MFIFEKCSIFAEAIGDQFRVIDIIKLSDEKEDVEPKHDIQNHSKEESTNTTSFKLPKKKSHSKRISNPTSINNNNNDDNINHNIVKTDNNHLIPIRHNQHEESK